MTSRSNLPESAGSSGCPRELEAHEIGEDYVLGCCIDELSVEYVRRLTLDRRGS